jgi:microsomal dipeptidase-like Zn-dependent dipeptidase
LTGDALRVELLKNLFSGKEKLAQTQGLMLYGSQAPMGGSWMGVRGASKTTVLLGLRGVASIRDDLRWADVFSKQGINFVKLDQPESLFNDQGLSDEGKRILEALGKANLLLIVKGLSPVQAKSLLENASKPVFLQTNTLPDKDLLGLVKKTESAVGLVLDKDEDAASYVKKIGEAKKAIGAEYLSIVSENCLWEKAGREQMLNVVAELLKAKVEIGDLANLFSGAFMRALNRAIRP